MKEPSLSVQLYAIGLNRTIAREDNRTITEKITDGAAIVRNIRGLKQRSITGQNFIVSSKADVQTYFEVLQVLDQLHSLFLRETFLNFSLLEG